MALDAVANFVRGTTDAAVDNTQTTVSVTDATIFPDPGTQGEYNVVIWDADSFPRPDQDPSVEVLRVTAIDTGVDELTVTRGQEGTSGASHPSGSAVHLSPTAKMFSDIQTKTKGLSDDGTTLNIEQTTYDIADPLIQVAGSSSKYQEEDITVDTSETLLFELPVNDGAFAVIKGIRNDSAGATNFIDIVTAVDGSTPSSLKNGRSLADTRTYGTNSTGLTLTMGADTYTVDISYNLIGQ